jgi:hypothetical protein
MYNVTALTDSSGNVAEAYDTDPYGHRLLFTAAGADTNWFTDDDTQAEQGIGNIGHQGLYHDE